MFLLKRIALAAAMSCCSESAIAEVAKTAGPAKSEAAPQQSAEAQAADADVSIAVKPSP